MQLVNTTPCPAAALVAEHPSGEGRLGLLVARATFRMAPGTPAETDDPLPVVMGGSPEANAGQPRDDLPRADDAFEVVLLGSAHAPGQREVAAMRVSVSVGDVRRELRVTGDRVWERGPRGAPVPGRPRPFARMPLTWARAFGGHAHVEVDAGARVPILHPENPAGRGFDPLPQAEALSRLLGAPPGFPRLPPGPRPLPNLEDPAAPVRRWGDAPPPLCWAPVPSTSGLQARRSVAVEAAEPGAAPRLLPGAFHQAHPDWVIPLPPAGADVRLSGLSAGGDLAFRLPPLGLAFDHDVAGRRGRRRLAPQMLVLEPDRGRFSVVYRHLFRAPPPDGRPRTLRLRADGAWAPAQRS